MNRAKAAAEWFHSTVFTDEEIRPREVRSTEPLPVMIRTARSLENGTWQHWQSRESIFMKQGKLLANYEDDYDYRGSVRCYYPTYQSLSDQELRGYFAWRTQLRKGNIQKTSTSFAFLYIYELINQIGVADAMDGYRRLVDFKNVYSQIDGNILPYLKWWITDYVIYYGLDPELLSDSTLMARERDIAVLERIRERDEGEVACAVRRLSPKWLKRSKFYGANQEDMDAVIVRVLRRVSDHYSARCKKTMVEQYFGVYADRQVRLFDAAVFCDPLKKWDYEYPLEGQCVCRCKGGIWSIWGRLTPAGSKGKLDELLKTIDSVMRQEFGDRHPVKAEVDTKWILKIIWEEVERLAATKRAAEAAKVTIDYAQLTQIRRDAAVTREKLIVEEETEPAPPEPEQAPAPPERAGETPLTPAEYRLLQCLLYGGDTGWVQASGQMLSVLVDGINEKLYDVFLDSVLDDTPELIEDYIDDLKEMVRP